MPWLCSDNVIIWLWLLMHKTLRFLLLVTWWRPFRNAIKTILIIYASFARSQLSVRWMATSNSVAKLSQRTAHLGRPQSRQSAKHFLQSSELVLPKPLTRGRVCPPPPVLGGGAHSLAREGLPESQFRRGDIYCGTLYINVLCGSVYLGPSWKMWEVKKTTCPLLLSDWSTLWTLSREVVYGSRKNLEKKLCTLS